MKKIQVIDTMHVIDVDQNAISQNTHDYLYQYCRVYQDLENNEDLYNPHKEWENDEIPSPEIMAELKALSEAANKYDAAYVRFINH